MLLLIAAMSLLVLSFHVRLKKPPDEREIRFMSEMSGKPSRWLGRVAPNFKAPLLDGGTYELADHVGKDVLILNFFATWCRPCREEMPELIRYQKAMAGQPVRIIAVNASEDPELVRKFVAEMKMSFPVVMADDALLRSYEVSSFPTTVVIAPDGRVQRYEQTAIMNADVTLRPAVELALTDRHNMTRATRETFLAEQGPARPAKGDPEGLTGRKLAIAKAMDCPCGCSDKVLECSCATAKKLRAKLKNTDYGAKPDAEIMTELNAEFCMKGMT